MRLTASGGTTPLRRAGCLALLLVLAVGGCREIISGLPRRAAAAGRAGARAAALRRGAELAARVLQLGRRAIRLGPRQMGSARRPRCDCGRTAIGGGPAFRLTSGFRQDGNELSPARPPRARRLHAAATTAAAPGLMRAAGAADHDRGGTGGRASRLDCGPRGGARGLACRPLRRRRGRRSRNRQDAADRGTRPRARGEGCRDDPHRRGDLGRGGDGGGGRRRSRRPGSC